MKRYLYLPRQFDLVVGEPFELFYRGIVNSAVFAFSRRIATRSLRVL